MMKCDLCSEKDCHNGKKCDFLDDDITALYSGSDDQKIMQVAAAVEGCFYMQKTRVEELVIFCKEMGYKNIGVAFCGGLDREAATLCAYLRKFFTVSSICCKNCGVDKDIFALKKIRPGNFEAMCNPIMQAKVLADKKSEFNVTVGLCLGHDLLFNKHSHVMVTTLIVKDRVLAHNPAGALYTRHYERKFISQDHVDQLNTD